MANSVTTVKTESDSVELTKNSRGYNWTIKLYSEDIEKTISYLEALNNRMKQKFGEEK